MVNPVAQALATPFVWGAGGAQLTPEQVAREREIAQALMEGAVDVSPVDHWTQGAARMANALAGKIKEYRANKQEETGRKAWQENYGSKLLSGFTGGNSGGMTPQTGNVAATSTSMATTPAPDYASARVAQAHGDSTLPAGGNLSERQRAFVESLLPAAIEESQRTGVDPRIIVAQAAQETGWGRSAPGNNYFGIKSHGKAGGQTLKTHEYIGGKRVNVADSFRTFASPADSVRGYGDFILQNPRYKALREAQGLDAQLAALQASGYATDPNYSKSVGTIARAIPLPETVLPQTASGLTPEALQSWGMTAYAPSQPNTAVDVVNALGEAQPVAVAETEADILAQEAAMAAQDPQAFRRVTPGATTGGDMLIYDDKGMRVGPATYNEPTSPNVVPYEGPGAATDFPSVIYDDKGFRVEGGAMPVPMLPEPRMVEDRPVAGVAGALTQNAVNPDLPMAGNTSGFAPINPVAQALVPQPAGGLSLQDLFAAASDPWAPKTAAPIVQALIEQQMQANDPMRQLQIQKLQAEIEAMRNPQPKDTDDIREYHFAVQQGYRGSFQDFMTDMKRAGAMNVNVDTGTIPQGYEAIRDENGRVIRYQPIPGGPADTSAAEAAAAESQEVSTDTVMAAAKKARQALRGPGLPATGTVGKLMSALPESNAAEVRRQVAVMQATARIENLQAMRAASPTGGALGNVSDAEGAMLAAKAGALDPDSPTFERDLDDYERTLLRIIHGKKVGDAIFEQTRENEGGDWQDFGGVKIRRKQ